MKDILGNHLQNGKRNAILGDPPAERARDVAHARRRDGLHVEPCVVVLAEVLQDLCAADG